MQVVGALPWQIVETEGIGVPGVPTVGVTITFVDVDADGPLHPLAVTLTIAVPENRQPMLLYLLFLCLK